MAWQQQEMAWLKRDPGRAGLLKAYYREHPKEFINHWCWTYDPRNEFSPKPTYFPLVMFPRQAELVDFIVGCITNSAPGLIEKSRDMGATWIACCLSVWLWLFMDGPSIGWGSQKAEQVDELGNPKSIFEKMRILLRRVPEEFLPKGFSLDRDMIIRRIRNPETGAVIAGDIGDSIGRGDRTSVYFKDESAWYEHPELIEASLSNTTRVPIDISSVSGLGNLFHRKREAGVVWEPGQEFVKHAVNVFVMDWRDHPEKTEEWYQTQRRFHIDQGTPAVLAREIDRDYAGTQEGVIIPAEHVAAAIDAHIKLGFDDSGANIAGLDVADGGGDRNALARRKGVVLKVLEEWGERDTGVTTRRAIEAIGKNLPCELQYDCIGVGSGVKAEANRLADDKLLPKGLVLIPWHAGARVLEEYKRVIDEDKNSAINKDMFQNLKAQAWYQVSRRFWKTFKAVTEPDEYKFDPAELISIPSDLPLLRQLQKELSQAVMIMSTRMKLVVDKTPEGARSPNLADALVMCYFPWHGPKDATVSHFGPRIIYDD